MSRGALILVAAAMLAGCAGTAPTPQIITITAPPAVTVTVTETLPPAATPTAAPTFTITGTITMRLDDTQTSFTGSGSSCVGKGGFDDIRPGAQVVVTDQSGQIIARSSLGEGEIAGGCVFSFSVPSVPAAEFYAVEVSHRGGLTYSRADLEANGWTVALTLG